MVEYCSGKMGKYKAIFNIKKNADESKISKITLFDTFLIHDMADTPITDSEVTRALNTGMA